LILNNKTFINEETHEYKMPIERSIHINDKYDWTIADFLLKNKEL
jgi:CMP-N-acetylneuraminic acid synthetase